MKELSVEEKAKRYDEAIKKAKSKIKNDKDHVLYEDDVIEMFPELAESEDERIRKELISFIQDKIDEINLKVSGDYDDRDADDIAQENWCKKTITWLEKQGEQKTIDEIAKEVCKNKVSAMTFLKSAGIMNEKGELADEYKIEQGEQNPEEVDNLHNYLYSEQKSTDKVKPKIKAGDWVVCNNGPHHIFQVIERSWPNAKYRDINGTEIFLNVNTLDKQYHLWTIQDAKDGDVLFTSSTASHETFIFKSIDEKGNAECYFAYDSEDGFREGKYHFIGSAINCKPATKEQRDLLFQKIKENGYEWDAEKKELKKVEQKPAEEYNITGIGSKNAQGKLGKMIKNLKSVNEVLEQGSAWSEEDEKMIWAIPLVIDTYPKQEMFYGYSKEKLISWIKSIKDRVQIQDRINIEVWVTKNKQWILKLNGKVVRGQWGDEPQCIFKQFFYLSEIESLKE